MGAGSLKILTGVLEVHRVARPLRGSVSCGSGWSVPCVSIQLTLSQDIGLSSTLGLWLEFRSETGLILSTFTAQIVRIFIAHQMSSVFLWSICLFTQCIRNQHFRIFYFK